MQGLKVAKVLGGTASAGTRWAASKALGKLLADEKAASAVVKALQTTSKVAPGINANIYRGVADALGGSSVHK